MGQCEQVHVKFNQNFKVLNNCDSTSFCSQSDVSSRRLLHSESVARRTYDVLTNKKAIQDRKILDKIRKGDQGIEKENTHQETQKE